ncbi:MAG: 30S ribosomal protein S17 [Nanoarchaeota archaeon]|nr:30S ribosomal protein S17 [Nanoarchaeota archaeon]
MDVKNIGIKVAKPKGKCSDNNCPFHGKLQCRGRIFVGTVISVKMQKTVIVEWGHKHFLRKYERYEKRRSRVKVHNTACINANEGNIVKIMECRPLSKTKNFVIVEILGKERGFKERMEAEEESKVKKEVKVDDEQIKAEEEATV